MFEAGRIHMTYSLQVNASCSSYYAVADPAANPVQCPAGKCVMIINININSCFY